MGCFLGCFGFSSKRKRRKSAHGGLHRGQRLGRYETLDSAYANLDIKEEDVISQSELSKKPKETLKSKIRKKVSFNLNVQTYEPIPTEEESDNLFWENDGEGKGEEKTSKKTVEEFQSCPPNYRTKTVRSVGDSNEGGMNQNARDGCRGVLSVLKPVENLSQWKAVKAQGLALVKQQRKENAEPMQQQEVQKSLLDVSNSMCDAQEIAMDASLSSWVAFSGSYQSNIEPISKSATVEAERSSYSWGK